MGFADLPQPLLDQLPPERHDLVGMAEVQEPLEAVPDRAVVGDVAFVVPVVLPGGLGRDLPDLAAGLRDELIDVPFLERDPLAEFLVDLGEAPHERPGEVGQLALRLVADVLLDLGVPVGRDGRPLARASFGCGPCGPGTSPPRRRPTGIRPRRPRPNPRRRRHRGPRRPAPPIAGRPRRRAGRPVRRRRPADTRPRRPRRACSGCPRGRCRRIRATRASAPAPA